MCVCVCVVGICKGYVCMYMCMEGCVCGVCGWGVYVWYVCVVYMCMGVCLGQVVVAHTFNPSTGEAEAGGFLSSRLAWSTK